MIRSELNRRGWKDAEFARRLDWSKSRLSRALDLEGDQRITLDDLEEILRALGIDCAEILERIGNIVDREVAPKSATAEIAEPRADYAATSPLRQRAEDLRERADLFEALEKLTLEVNELKKKGGH